jgi:hypothetical protein
LLRKWTPPLINSSDCMASTCWFYSWDVVRAVVHPNNNQLFLISFYIVISYKDNDFITSNDIYSKKVNITMALYKRMHFSAE